MSRGNLKLASLHFSKNIRRSDISEARPGRGNSAALRETTRRWSFHGIRRGHRPSASLCGIPFGFADESGLPGRCFRESRRRPHAQTKLLSQKTKIKSEGGQVNLRIQKTKNFTDLRRGAWPRHGPISDNAKRLTSLRGLSATGGRDFFANQGPGVQSSPGSGSFLLGRKIDPYKGPQEIGHRTRVL